MAETRSVPQKGADRRSATQEETRSAEMSVSANASPTIPSLSEEVPYDANPGCASEKTLGQNVFQAPGRTIYSEQEKWRSKGGLSLFELFRKDMDVKLERWSNLDEGDHNTEALEEVLRRVMEEMLDKLSPLPPGLNSVSQRHRGLSYEEAMSISNALFSEYIDTTNCDDTNWY